MNTQSKIDTEIEAMIILSKLLEYHDGYIWTLGTFADFLRWELATVEGAVKWLMSRGLVVKNLGSYQRTEEGREYYEGAITKPEFQISILQWKTEALTGVKQSENKPDNGNWQKSDIENGVLPKSLRHKNTGHETTPESVYFEREQEKINERKIRKLAQSWGITVRQFNRLLKQNRIKFCRGYKNTGSHIGRFHRKGNGVQHLCVECRRLERRGE